MKTQIIKITLLFIIGAVLTVLGLYECHRWFPINLIPASIGGLICGYYGALLFDIINDNISNR